MIKITEEEYASLCESNTTMLVLFGATWCQPCQQLAQVLVDMEPDYEGQILFTFRAVRHRHLCR